MFCDACVCLLPVSVEVCACLSACDVEAGVGQGCSDGDGVDIKGVPAVWRVRSAAVREEVRA